MFNFVIFFLLVSSSANFIEAKFPELCWRPFMGIVPLDAIVGSTTNGINTYIGKVELPNENVVLTGELFDGQSYMTIISPSDGSIQNIIGNVYILCSDFPEFFYWVVQPKLNFLWSGDYYRVDGGVAPDKTIRYIGRGKHNDVWRIGSVFLNRMYFINYEKGNLDALRNFEVLVYSNTTIGQSCLF